MSRQGSAATGGPLDAESIARGVIDGNRQMLARAITLVESENPVHGESARRILEQCITEGRHAMRIAVTGSPGAGKSTFIESLGEEIIASGRTLAILAVDPSSLRSRGSILGDKARMEKLAARKEAFIRPTASSGHLGGGAPKTHETMLLLEAAGYEVIILETVGVGQSEVHADAMTDFVLLLMLPGSGDELQGIKRGIMEIADAVGVTKADGERMELAKATASDFSAALGMLPEKHPGHRRKVLLTSARSGAGIKETWEEITGFFDLLQKSGELELRQLQQRSSLLRDLVEWGLRKAYRSDPAIQQRKAEIEAEVAAGRLSPFEGADLLVEAFTLRR